MALIFASGHSGPEARGKGGKGDPAIVKSGLRQGAPAPCPLCALLPFGPHLALELHLGRRAGLPPAPAQLSILYGPDARRLARPPRRGCWEDARAGPALSTAGIGVDRRG